MSDQCSPLTRSCQGFFNALPEAPGDLCEAFAFGRLTWSAASPIVLRHHFDHPQSNCWPRAHEECGHALPLQDHSSASSYWISCGRCWTAPILKSGRVRPCAEKGSRVRRKNSLDIGHLPC